MNRSILGALVGIIMISGALFGQGTTLDLLQMQMVMLCQGQMLWLKEQH